MSVAHGSLYDELDARGVIPAHTLELRARAARAEAIADAVIAAARAVGKLVGRALVWYREDAARQELLAMTDRELADIGLSRADLHRKDLFEIARERELPPRAVASVAPAAAANENDAPRHAA